MADRIEAVRLLQQHSYSEVSGMLGIHIKTIEPWPRFLAANAARIPRNLPGAGRPLPSPSLPTLRAFLVEQRERNRGVNAVTMMEWVKLNQPEWLQEYMERATDAETAYTSLRRLVRKAAGTLSFRWRRARPASKLTPALLAAEKAKFVAMFWQKHADLNDADVINVDETGMFLDTHPRYTFAEVSGATQVGGDEKNRRA
ncbi:hypothetical protein ACHHYP_11385 [Achlya hypogyna]|uniref:Uncharacterized protein n=1 Tax=Achlya hypogyna TaxID=1202772 RepID=A0A1V9YJ85_ACHHY|nr:hypothetical protein ACHHYP_11385 [Achlya hypogyna]